MRTFSTIILSLGAALAAAQETNGPNAFNIPAGQSTYTVTAGGTVDLTWTNQQGSSVTIKLQQSGNVTPDSGVVLAQSIPNTGSTTVTIPSSADIPPTGSYTFEIIDDSSPNTYNFSPNFSVASASGTGSFGPSATGSVSSGSASTTGTASTTGSSASASATTTGSSSARTSSSAAASTTSATATTSSATTSETTSAPNSNAGAKVQAPLAAAIMLGAAAFF